jgi:hypothetical protein
MPVFDAAAKRQAVETVARLMADEYVFPDSGARAAAMLRQNLTAGKYEKMVTRADFAAQVEADLRDVVHDRHLRVFGWDEALSDDSPDAPSTPPPLPTMGEFKNVDRLKGNIGYIRFDGYPLKSQFEWAADKAIGLIVSTDALIIDLRNNHGGGDTLAPEFLASFFVDGKMPVHLLDILARQPGTNNYDREIHSTESTPVSYLGKPVYLLTSRSTFSGGEAFAYDMQALKRATVVGEATGGGAHGTDFKPICPGMSMLLPTANAESAITQGNWEGKGVQPDIAVPAEQGFTTAYATALRALGRGTQAAASQEAVTEAHLLVVSRTTALPGSEAALRSWIAGLVAGHMREDLLATNSSRPPSQFLPTLLAAMRTRGELQSLTFAAVALGGGDVYEATFADKSKFQYTIYLNEDGKILYVLSQPY